MKSANADTFPADMRLFDEALIHPDVRRHNDQIVQRLSAGPELWDYTVPQIRTSRAKGRGSFPLFPPDPLAVEMEIPGGDNAITVRIIRPTTRTERGTYLHFHGGGWIMGTPAENDNRLRRLVENTGLATVSVDYRLAPETPFPGAVDDCAAAAHWLLDNGGNYFNTSFLAIGGESAGAHLAALTLLRLRDTYGSTQFDAANLVAGCYDLGGTPSVRNWGTERLILRTIDVMTFCELFLQNNEDRRDPAVSPLFAELNGLPPALFSCGTKDLLIDDTLFMAILWAQAGNETETGIFPGGCHVFQSFDTVQAKASLAQIEAFLEGMIIRKFNAP